jgi:hypothetical protein
MQVQRLIHIGGRAFLAGMGHALQPGLAGGGKHAANLAGGCPTSEESSPPRDAAQPFFGAAEGGEGGLLVEMAQEAQDQLRGEAFAAASSMPASRPSITVSMGMPRSVWVCGSKKISAWVTPSAAARVK